MHLIGITKRTLEPLKLALLLTGFGAPSALALKCNYSLVNEWQSGFLAEITVTNDRTTALESWQVTWNYEGGDYVDTVWNASLETQAPYSASCASWNCQLAPNQTTRFSFIGKKSSPTAEIPHISDKDCYSHTSQIPPASASDRLIKVGSAETLLAIINKKLTTDLGPINGYPILLEGDLASSNLLPTPSAAPEFITESADSAPGSSATDGGFSTTNTIVQGVDESDWVKYTGEYAISIQDQFLFISKTSPETASFEIVFKAPVTQLFNQQNRYARPEIYIAPNNNGAADFILVSKDSTSEIKRFKFDNATKMLDEIWSYSTSNRLRDTRKVGDTLYMIQNLSINQYYNYWSYFYAPYPEQTIRSTTLSMSDLNDRIPDTQLSHNGNTITHGKAVNLADCYVDAKEEDISITQDGQIGDPLPEARPFSFFPPSPSFTFVNKIDLTKPELNEGLCTMLQFDHIHVSKKNMYLMTGNNNYGYFYETPETTTDVHQFVLEHLDYRGSGNVSGTIQGFSNPSFYMGQVDDALGIVTSKYRSWSDYDHMLSLLQPSSHARSLHIAGQIPNEQRPQDIGKPNESLYGIRFMGNRAYIVTFEKVDPLYVIDLSDLSDPYIAGELEVPGYSDYLHPISDTLLLGIGKNAAETNSNFSWFQGVKVELYDVSDIYEPKSLKKIDIGERGSRALGYKSLSFLQQDEDNLRVTIPATINEPVAGDDTIYEDQQFRPYSRTAVVQFNINTDTRDLTKVGEAILSCHISYAPGCEDINSYGRWGDMRSIQHDDAVFHFSSDTILSNFWSTPSQTIEQYFVTEEDQR